MLTASWGDSPDESIAALDWIWPGIIGPGQITLLTGLWKAGKTTLLSHFLACRHAGTALLDLAVRPGKTAIVTEETRLIWRRRLQKLGFGRDVCFFYRPFTGRPTPVQFNELIEQLLELHKNAGVDLVIVDPLSRFLPLRSENSSEAMLAALAPLHRLTDAELAVLLSHHPRKGQPAQGQAARGSGALPAFVDIDLELHPFAAGMPTDRRRLLFGRSRWDETPPSLMIELDADGLAYRVRPEEVSDEFPSFWPTLQIVLEDAREPLTRTEMQERWAEGCPRPSLRTLSNWLSAALARHLVARSGTGHSSDPFRYWLPSKMTEWQADPLWRLLRGMPLRGTEEKDPWE